MTLNFEEASKIRPPEDVIKELRDTETKSNYNHEMLKRAFATILSMPMLDMYTNMDDRCRAASKVLIAQLESRQIRTGAKQYPMECKIIDITGINEFVKEAKVKEIDKDTGETREVIKREAIDNAFVYVICSSPTENVEPEQAPFTSVRLGVLRLWGEACKLLSVFEKDKTYLVNCGVQPTDDYYKMSKNSNDGVELLSGEGSAPVKDMITRLFEPFGVAEADYHIGQYKLLHARIKSCRTSLNKKGNLQGNMIVSDVNAQFGKAEEGAPRKDLNISWWNAPEFCTQYGPGSEVYIMVDLVDKSDQYGLSGTGHFIIPILGLPTKTVFEMLDAAPANMVPTTPAPSWQPSQQTSKEESKTNDNKNSSVPSPAAIGKW